MENSWIFLVALYGIIKGCREILKKKALTVSTVEQVLFFYSALGFLLVIPTLRSSPLDVLPWEMGIILLKSAVIFIAWICSFSAIRKIPLGLYGVMDMARMLFSALLAVLFLQESTTLWEVAGYIIVAIGLVAVNLGNKKKNEAAGGWKAVALVLCSCLLNAVSGILDKVVTKRLDTGVLQFWYMLFLSLFYMAYLLLRERKISLTVLTKNPWVILLSVIFIIGDRALFAANANPNAKVTVMTLIKQCSVLIVILLGRIVYKEKRFLYRLGCALIIIAGIFVSLCG